MRATVRDVPCPVCAVPSHPYAVVDLNKSCAEMWGVVLSPTGIRVPYHRCHECGFCFSAKVAKWSLDQFEDRIYNDQYVQVDPDYVEVRPRNNAGLIQSMFGESRQTITHLDYGGGNGLLSSLLRAQGWRSASYDPFVDRQADVATLGKHDLVTAFEVFEHAPDPGALMADICSLLSADGIVLFSTLLSDGHITPEGSLAWWYASPRNGHISLYSRKSLGILAAKSGFELGSFNDGLHCMWRTIPRWASHAVSGKT